MATTYDNASLVMIPSGVKEDKLYSIKPTDGSGDFTFSRGSDIQATRVNSSGLIEKAKVNLLTYSNTFSSWSGSGISVTSGQSGYDGSSDAWLLDITGGTGSQYRGINVSATGVHTTSVYAKAGTLNWVLLLEVGGGSCYFDLQNGIVGTNSGTIDASIEAVGATGWYRISYAQNNTITQLRIYPATGNSNVSQSSGNIYIQDAQLNYGLIAQDYVETTTTAVVEGLTADLPRLDYSGGASCPSLLLEPSRTNKNLQSEYFNTWYTLDAQTATANAALSPEGVQNAALIERASSSGNSRLQTPIVSVASGASVVHSIFLKAHTANNVIMYSPQGGEGKKFDISAGTAGDDFISAPDDYGIEPYADDWYRIWIVSTMPSTSAQCWVYIDESDTTGFYAYGFQTEEGSYPTSYIPTYGTAANRGRDITTKTSVSSLIGQTEGTIFAEVQSIPNNDTAFLAPTLSDGTLNNSLYILRYTSGGVEYVEISVRSGGVLGVDQRIALSVTDGDKFAFAYKQNDFVVYRNGTQILSDTSGNVSAMSNVYLGQNYNGSATTRGDFKQALLFKTRLTNAELAALTA